MLFRTLKPGTVTTFLVVGAVFDSLVAAVVVAWLLSDGTARQIAVALLLSAGPTFVGLSLFFYWMASGPARGNRFLKRGTRGLATVKNAHMTGARINAMPVLKLDLEVSVPGRPAYPARGRVLAYPGTIERESTLECVVDPKHPQRVVVLHEQSLLKEPQRIE
jgi:hypothetical protein